jgi:hypothetical protein
MTEVLEGADAVIDVSARSQKARRGRRTDAAPRLDGKERNGLR